MRIGGGGSCDVYKAEVFGVAVAVKVLTLAAKNAKNQKKQDSEERQFVAEKQLLMKVQHPNICRCYAVFCIGYCIALLLNCIALYAYTFDYDYVQASRSQLRRSTEVLGAGDVHWWCS
jgi:hypothetical protein